MCIPLPPTCFSKKYGGKDDQKVWYLVHVHEQGKVDLSFFTLSVNLAAALMHNGCPSIDHELGPSVFKTVFW